MFYKTILDGFVVSIGETSGSVAEPNYEITESQYNAIMELITNKPTDTEEVVYKLVADSMTYEPFEAPPIEPIEEPNNDYGLPNDLYDAIIDEYTMMLIEEGVIE